MFRPLPETALFRTVPFRLIAPVLLILASVVSLIVLFSIEHEKFVVHGLTEGKAVPLELFQAFWQSRRDLIGITALLFLMSAIGITAVVTFIPYQNTRRTLEEVKSLARNILQSIPTGVLTINRDGIITAANPAAEQVLRRPCAALLGYAYQAVFAEGDTIQVALAQALREHLYLDQKDLPYEDAQRMRRTIRVSTAALAGDDGDLAGVILQAQDVTDWLALEQRVRTAEKLTALHTLSAGMAHELRNPLSAMDLNQHLLEEELRETGRLSPLAAQYLNVLKVESHRLARILDNFLKFARPEALRPHQVDIRGLIAHVASLLRHEAKDRHIRLETEVASDLPKVLGDDIQISQLLVNILVNAFHAMPEGGLCRIAAGRRGEGGQESVVLTVQDTGIGIKQEDLPRLFEPFYTTKADGSGLGLAIAYRIVQDHGGTIAISSGPGNGTQVTILLPVMHASLDMTVSP